MGNPGPNEPRRRYARPGEFEIPNSILESDAFSQRLGTELNPDSESKTGPPVEKTRQGGDVNLNQKSPAPAPKPLRQSEELSRVSDRKGNAPVTGEVRQRAELNPTPKVAASSRSGQRLSQELNPVSNSPAPLPAGQRVSGESNSNRRSPAPLTRANVIPRKNMAARFELLPEAKWRWDRIGWSAAGQVAAVAFLVLSPTIFPQQMQTALKYDVVDVKQPVTHIKIEIEPATPPPPPPKIKPKVPPPEPKPILPKPKQVVVEAPVLNPRQPHVFVVLKPELPKVHKVEVKPVELRKAFQPTEIVLTSKQPARPKEEVKVANLNSGSPAPATVAAPPNKVQTGGFGDPNGLPGVGNPNKAGNINQAGSPNLPGGPGSGNGTGGAQGMRGTVASDGSKTSASAAGGMSSGVEVLYEPNPAYTQEARLLKMEGDVVLEVVFLASGQLQVTRVVSGLGHGLDEAAIQAAKQIRFRPAKQNGNAIDFAARVRIEFRLSK